MDYVILYKLYERYCESFIYIYLTSNNKYSPIDYLEFAKFIYICMFYLQIKHFQQLCALHK